MSVRLDIEIRRLSKTLKNLEDTNFKTINKNIAVGLRKSTLERFKKEQSPDNKKWEKRKYGNSRKKLLKDTSTLRNSIKAKADNKIATVGTNLKYASTHQFGAKNKRIKARNCKLLKFRIDNKWISTKEVTVNIPARQFLGISEEDKKEIKDVLEYYVEKAIKG
ncbi:phage virion morphogenesis protein [[Clostridium] colinum]|uniref:phage virion morphogenesis protein n=1 Tax=[Clostridium] colinum TaxID=36835 RepID=UPI00202472A3|nr:phage virion morphogenesis protein [[Clostridium] colinum]